MIREKAEESLIGYFRVTPNLSERQLSCTVSIVEFGGAGGAQCSGIPLTLQAHLKERSGAKKGSGNRPNDTRCVEKWKVGAIVKGKTCEICSEGSFLPTNLNFKQWLSVGSPLGGLLF